MAKNNEVIGSYIDDMVRFARITARVTEDLKMHDFVDTRIESL